MGRGPRKAPGAGETPEHRRSTRGIALRRIGEAPTPPEQTDPGRRSPNRSRSGKPRRPPKRRIRARQHARGQLPAEGPGLLHAHSLELGDSDLRIGGEVRSLGHREDDEGGRGRTATAAMLNDTRRREPALPRQRAWWGSAAPGSWRGRGGRRRRRAGARRGRARPAAGDRRRRWRRCSRPDPGPSARELSREQLVGEDPPRELVGAPVDLLAADLLRRHVRGGARDARALAWKTGSPRESGRGSMTVRRATPKSSTFTRPSCRTITFSGLTSRWTTPSGARRRARRRRR